MYAKLTAHSPGGALLRFITDDSGAARPRHALVQIGSFLLTAMAFMGAGLIHQIGPAASQVEAFPPPLEVAETEAPSFRRVGPPEEGQSRLITIQIDPGAENLLR